MPITALRPAIHWRRRCQIDAPGALGSRTRLASDLVCGPVLPAGKRAEELGTTAETKRPLQIFIHAPGVPIPPGSWCVTENATYYIAQVVKWPEDNPTVLELILRGD